VVNTIKFDAKIKASGSKIGKNKKKAVVKEAKENDGLPPLNDVK
jgi:hypothetical protein